MGRFRFHIRRPQSPLSALGRPASAEQTPPPDDTRRRPFPTADERCDLTGTRVVRLSGDARDVRAAMRRAQGSGLPRSPSGIGRPSILRIVGMTS